MSGMQLPTEARTQSSAGGVAKRAHGKCNTLREVAIRGITGPQAAGDATQPEMTPGAMATYENNTKQHT